MKIYSLLIILGLVMSSTISYSQDETAVEDTSPWKIDLSTGVNFNQAAFSQNWSGGGINSVGLNLYLLFKANYKKGRHNWDNTIDMVYGFVNTSGQGFRKTQDLILIDTKYGYDIAKSWQIFGSLTFQSQFVEGYRYEDDSLGVEQELLISDWLAPGYFTLAIGAEYKPNDNFFVRISPITPRLTVVRRDDIIINVPRNYGVEPGETTRLEGYAGQILSEFGKDIAPNLNLKARYRMFINYENFNWQEIDHRLGVIFTTNVVKLIDVTLSGIVLYDYDQDIGVQWSQGLNIGLAYKFKNFVEEE